MMLTIMLAMMSTMRIDWGRFVMWMRNTERWLDLINAMNSITLKHWAPLQLATSHCQDHALNNDDHQQDGDYEDGMAVVLVGSIITATAGLLSSQQCVFPIDSFCCIFSPGCPSLHCILFLHCIFWGICKSALRDIMQVGFWVQASAAREFGR